MASSIPSIIHFQSLILLLFFTSQLFVTESKNHLHPSDHAAISIIKKELGITSQLSSQNPCNTSEISCELFRWKNSNKNNNSYVLKITRIVFKSQDLKGHLSPAIGRLSELKELSLPNNKLIDQIPSSISKCKKLHILDLKNNEFSSKVPFEISSLVHLKVLDLSSNKLSGDLSFLKYFPNLETLSLSDNLFSGKVPSAIKSFRKLTFLNLSENSLLQLTEDVQIEEYSSKLPNRYVFAENSTQPNQISSNSTDNSSNSQEKKDKKKKKNVGGWILGFVAGIVGGSLSGLVFSVLFKLVIFCVKGGKNKDSSLSIFSPFIKKAEDLAFLEKEDDGFSSLEIIGRGGCGEVYKAELSNGKFIAIKKVIQPPREAGDLGEEDSKYLNKKMRQIKSEIQTVGQIRHRNLLPLLAHMPRPECHYLVYEYMKNGSLQDILQQVTEGKRELDWLSRHRIAIGIASGLEYLHMNHTPRIIHRDLKPANVLLDDDMEARISDFGLAKAMPEAYTHVTTSNVAGTVGYIAPEYHQTLKFTDKCDIYSFGVLLGVLVIGKLPSDEFFQHTSEMSLVKWMRNVMTSEDPKRAIDASLLFGDDKVYEEQMLLVLKIACFCTLDMPKERPNSKEIRLMLAQINH
ncbi:hypothetical protein LIER_09007 [Lithospermum erythrorhizon]|uniref:Protein kinase domain-containing protein n=1 Tax=Lithospermum erythrorhizon TaxID=34254 RepID=A0AAV3PGZ2_LITER